MTKVDASEVRVKNNNILYKASNKLSFQLFKVLLDVSLEFYNAF